MSEPVGKAVLDFYLSYPYPQWSKEERHRRFAAELCRYEFLGLDRFMPDARFIDVGCGTGNRSMLAAQHYGVKEFVGIDQSAESLRIASEVAREEGFDRFKPIEGSLFEVPYPDASFDVVVSWGVLHHTADPYRGFKEMVRICRPGGFVGIFLYNKWNHLRHNLQKNKIDRLAGDDVQKRVEVALELYADESLDQMDPGDAVQFIDKYCHPHKSDHTLGEILRWFDENGLDYWGSYIPLRIRDAIAAIRRRAELVNEYPVQSSLNKRLVKLSSLLPRFDPPEHPIPRPSVAQRFFWQAIYAFIGRHGDFSQGASLSARKRPAPS